VKPLIRLVKSWKYHWNVPIRSFYLEMRVAEYASKETAIIYRIDVKGALQWLQRSALNDMPDPMGISEPFSGGSYIDKQTALSYINTALGHAQNAAAAEANGRIADAFHYWDKVFNGRFPAYY
jgi:hypothetical protein